MDTCYERREATTRGSRIGVQRQDGRTHKVDSLIRVLAKEKMERAGWKRRSAVNMGKQPAPIRLLTILALIAGLTVLASTTTRATTRTSSQPASNADQAAASAAYNRSETSRQRKREEEAASSLLSGSALARHKRQVAAGPMTKPATGATDLTRIVAVSGQTIEFQCPLASELLASAHANPQRSAQAEQQQQQVGSRIIWRKDGQPLSQMNSTRLRLSQSHNSSSLAIFQAQPRLDEAAYECALVDGPQPAAHTKVHQFQLRLLVPPRLAPFEFPADAQVGMKVLLTCSALEGQQPISFVWLRDNQIIDTAGPSSSPSSPAPGSQSASESGGGRQQLVTTLAQLHQQQLADKFAMSAHAAISLGDKSEYVLIGAQKGGAGARSDDETSLAGEHAGGEQPLGDKQARQPASKSTMHLADASIRIRQADDYSILSIEPLELKHSGRYTCSAQNEAARVSHSSQLIINAPPTLTVEPRDGDLVSGRSIVIDCAATGQPRPTLSWLRARESNGGKQWDFVPIYENLRYTILSNGSLAINNVTQREQGFYMCSAKNGFGPEVTKLIKITVHEPARISSKYKLVETRIEEQAQMSCEADGEPPLSLVWLDKEGKQIDKADKRFIIDDSNSQPVAASGPSSAKTVPKQAATTTTTTTTSTVAAQLNVATAASSLIIARSSRADSGHYTCQAANKHGQDKMVANLLVQDVPDKVGELKVTNVTATTISLRWQLGFAGNSPVTSYLVQYQSDDPLDDLLMSVAAKSGQTAGGGQQQLESLTTAAPATPHLATSDGLFAASGLYKHLFGLDDDRDREQQDKQQQQQQQASSIRAALETLNSLGSSLGDLSVTSADEAIDRTLVELTVEQTATSLVIKDLSPFCVYRLRLAGINKIGLGEFSEWIRAKTEEAPPSGSALKISATATGPNSIKLTWLPPDRRAWNGQLVQFQIGYRPIDSSYEFNKSVEWTPPTLMQSIMFDVDASGKRRNQDGKQQTTRTTTTDSAPASNSSSTSAPAAASKQRGSPREGGSSPYALRQHLRQLLAMQQQELVAHLTNLQRSTTYLVWIQAVNGRGPGPQSHAISVKTLDDVPPSAPALKIQSASTSSITIAWSMLSNFVSPANQYSLFYRRAPPPSTALRLPAGGGPLSKFQPQFHPARQFQTLAAGEANASAPSQAGADNSLAIFSEPGPFVELTISSQRLIHAMMGQQQMAGDGGLIETKLGGGYQSQQQQQYQRFEYTLEQLECGSSYELYMTTRNSVGKSEPSVIVSGRTLGEPPLAPHNKNSLFAKIGAQDVLLNLASWSTGGCPLTHVNVRYKQLPLQPAMMVASKPELSSSSPGAPISMQQTGSHSLIKQPSFSVAWPVSTSVPNNLLDAINQQQQQQQSPVSSVQGRAIYASQAASVMSPISTSQALLVSNTAHLPSHANNDPSGFGQPATAQFSLNNLQPSTGYELEIVAHNAAGHTTAQYEFVTAGPNGSRSGYTRREGVFRLDQRGQPIETGNEHQSAFAADHQGGNQPGASSHVSSVQQLVPLVLTLLCIVCLIVSSAFCYHRLAGTLKERHRRRSIDGLRSICSGSNGGHTNGSDESHLAKTGGLQNWPRLMSGAGDGGASSRGLKSEPSARRFHSELVDDHSPSSINTSDSPPATDSNYHYCLREPFDNRHQLHHHHHHLHRNSSMRPNDAEQRQQISMSATLNPKSSSFSQSVSMRDFNIIGPLGQSVPAATLNIKNGRAVGQRLKQASAGAAGLANEFGKMGATMARSRHLETAANIPMAESYGGNASVTDPRMCQNYITSPSGCKQKQDSQAIYSRQQHNYPQQALENAYVQDTCNYPINFQDPAAQSHETSWTTAAGAVPTGSDQRHLTANGTTNYAVPASYQHQIEAAPADQLQQALPYPCEDVYNQGTIDACIQHLMSQQYQQSQHSMTSAMQRQQQQQQYALLVGGQRSGSANVDNQLQGRCVYGDPTGSAFIDSNSAADQQFSTNQQQQQQPQRLTGNYTMAGPAQSVIESTSSSSGIGVDSVSAPSHLDCGSTITSATAPISNHLQPYAQQALANGTAEQPQPQPADVDCN